MYNYLFEIICLPTVSTVLPSKYINVGYRHDSKCTHTEKVQVGKDQEKAQSE